MDKITEFIEKSDGFRRANNRNASLTFNQHIINAAPHLTIGYLRSTEDLLELGRTGDALNLITEALLMHPDDQQLISLSQSAKVKNKQKRIENFLKNNNTIDMKIKYIKSELEHTNELEELLYGVQIAEKLDEHEIALDFSQRLKENHPDNPIGFIKVIENLCYLEMFQGAKNIFSESLTQFPASPELLLTGNFLYRRIGDRNLALNYAEKFCNLLPKNSDGFLRVAEDQLTLGQTEKSLQAINQYLHLHNRSKAALIKARGLIRNISHRELSLDISTEIIQEHKAKANKEDFVELASDKISLNKLEEASEILKDNEILSDSELECLEKFLENKTLPTNENRALSTIEIEIMKKTYVYPHYLLKDFNTPPDTLSKIKDRQIIIVIHIGKCAGESIIQALQKSFSKTNTLIVEYHIFDSQSLIKKICSLSTEAPNIHFLVCTRDPLQRWISAFNWDYHTFFKTRQFYCPEEALHLFKTYSTCKQLASGITKAERDALLLAGYRHWAFGHMSMGASWYLPIEVIKSLPYNRTSVVRVENIKDDVNSFLEKTKDCLPSSLVKPIESMPTQKSLFKKRYPEGTFTEFNDLSLEEINAVSDLIKADQISHQMLCDMFLKSVS